MNCTNINYLKRILCVFILALFTFSGSSALAASETSPSEPSSISERAKELSQFRNLLNSDDKYTRWAAFEEGMKSDDLLIRRMTQDIAFSSDHEDLKTMALKVWFQQRDKIVADLKLPKSASDAQKKLYDEYAPSIVLSYTVEKNGELDGQMNGSLHSVSGNLTPNGLVATNGAITLKLDLVNPHRLEGTVASKKGIALPASAEIK